MGRRSASPEASSSPRGTCRSSTTSRCGVDVQAAIDAPRWHWVGGTLLTVEPGLFGLEPELRALGHSVFRSDLVLFGAGQIVLPVDGYWHGAADARQDSLAAGM